MDAEHRSAANGQRARPEDRRIQCDEIRAFVAKAKNVPNEKRGQWGDVWTWTAIDADSKMTIGYRVGQRTAVDAYDLMLDCPSG